MHGLLMHGQASRGLMSAELKKGYTGCRSYLMSAEDLGKGGRPTHSEILIVNEAIIKQRREGVQVSEEYVRRLEGQAHSTCLEAALSRSVEAARARCRETKRMRTWVSLSTQTLSKLSEPACVAQASYTMQTLVVVLAIYGVAFNGRGMTPAENRDTALALKRAFDCLLTPAWLSHVLTLCSAHSRDERAMVPVALMCLTASRSMRRGNGRKRAHTRRTAGNRGAATGTRWRRGPADRVGAPHMGGACSFVFLSAGAVAHLYLDGASAIAAVLTGYLQTVMQPTRSDFTP